MLDPVKLVRLCVLGACVFLCLASAQQQQGPPPGTYQPGYGQPQPGYGQQRGSQSVTMPE